MQRLADHESKSGREEVELAKIGGTVRRRRRGWGGGIHIVVFRMFGC